jgi:hypothetical protein
MVFYHPPHGLDLSSYDFHIFGSLKKVLRGHTLGLNEDTKVMMVLSFQQELREFFTEGTVS